MGESCNFGSNEFALWNGIAEKGCEEASKALSLMFGRPVTMTADVKACLPVCDLSNLENPNEDVIGARLVLSGDVAGEILFILPAAAWNRWKRDLIPDESPSPLETSAFAEVANIAGAFFIQNLSNVTALKMNFSPPQVLQDMFATVFEETLITISEETSEILVVETRLSISKTQINGFLFLIPSRTTIEKITKKLERL